MKYKYFVQFYNNWKQIGKSINGDRTNGMCVIKSIPITFETVLISVLVQSKTVLFVIRRMNACIREITIITRTEVIIATPASPFSSSTLDEKISSPKRDQRRFHARIKTHESFSSLKLKLLGTPWPSLSLPLFLSLSLSMSMSSVPANTKSGRRGKKKRRRKKSRVAITTNCIVTRKLRDYSVRANHRATVQYMWALW